ncbi:hypothetical protein FRB99_006845 [Tulasnella sp. 403]|nr:hypothetical protein FRB99_006845 [Tulasnella sp. 403]
MSSLDKGVLLDLPQPHRFGIPLDSNDKDPVRLTSSQTMDKFAPEDGVAPLHSKRPFGLIPVEIFQRIIHFALGDPTYPIKSRIDQLGLVCQSWKKGISTGGPYWIQIDYAAGESSWTVDLQKSRCLWVAFSYNQDAEGDDSMGPFLRLILDNMGRCCLLELTFVEGSTRSDAMKELIDLIIQHPAPVLQAFHIVLPQQYPSRVAYLTDANERKLEVDLRFLPHCSGMVQRVTSLNVTQSSLGGSIPMDSLFEITQNSPCLTDLAVTNLPMTTWSADKPSTPLVLSNLDSISLRGLPLDFISCVLSSLVAPRCTYLFVECEMGGLTIDALLDPACRSVNQLFESLAGGRSMYITAKRNNIHFSSGSHSGNGSFALVLGNTRNRRGALTRCFSFHQPSTLQNVKTLALSVESRSLDVLSLLEDALPSVETLRLLSISENGWEEVADYLSRRDGPQCWPLLDHLVVFASHPPYWRLTLHHFFYFLHKRLGIRGPDQEPKRKFGQLFVRGLFDTSLYKPGVWKELEALVDDLNISQELPYAMYGSEAAG